MVNISFPTLLNLREFRFRVLVGVSLHTTVANFFLCLCSVCGAFRRANLCYLHHPSSIGGGSVARRTYTGCTYMYVRPLSLVLTSLLYVRIYHLVLTT
jgi:hypothetical protein